MLRLRTLADVFAYAKAEGVKLRFDGTELQVRRPKAGRQAVGHSSRARRNKTPRTTVISDDQGRLLWTRAVRPGRMHDVTAVRTEGIEDLLFQHRKVRAEADSGYQGLARDFPDQITAPPKKPGPATLPDEVAEWAQTRKVQSSRRICVEHAIAELKQWRPLQRYIGRREYFNETMLAIAGLVSDRCAVR